MPPLHSTLRPVLRIRIPFRQTKRIGPPTWRPKRPSENCTEDLRDRRLGQRDGFICDRVIRDGVIRGGLDVRGALDGDDDYGGSYIANRVSDKITPICESVYCCRSGSAADTQTLADYARYYMAMHEIELNDKPRVLSAARLFRELCYQNKSFLMAGVIVAGYDSTLGGQVYTIPLGGAFIRQPFAIGGSGSTYIYGMCDSTYKEGMTKDECEAFVIKALSLAMARDGSSGGVIRLVTIDKEGTARRFVPGNKLPKFWEG